MNEGRKAEKKKRGRKCIETARKKAHVLPGTHNSTPKPGLILYITEDHSAIRLFLMFSRVTEKRPFPVSLFSLSKLGWSLAAYTAFHAIKGSKNCTDMTFKNGLDLM